MNAVPEDLQAQVSQVQEESDWEVFSEDEFQESSEESSDEGIGNQIYRRWRKSSCALA